MAEAEDDEKSHNTLLILAEQYDRLVVELLGPGVPQDHLDTPRTPAAAVVTAAGPR